MESATCAFSSAFARALPGVALRSTFIVGFPGETETEFEDLLDFVAAARHAVGGVFVFDPQDGTRAAALPVRCRRGRPSNAPPASRR